MKLNSLVVGLVLVGLGGLAWLNKQGPQGGGFPRADLSNPTKGLPEWQVVRVVDGDTIKVRRGEEEMTIRFCGIDAPEKAQELGPEATAMMQRLVDESGGWVLVDAVEQDRYGRTVAEVWSGEVGLFNSAMVGAGMAFVYERYLGVCVSAGAIASSGIYAQRDRLGIWNSSTVLEQPWEYRQRQRSRKFVGGTNY